MKKRFSVIFFLVSLTANSIFAENNTILNIPEVRMQLEGIIGTRTEVNIKHWILDVPNANPGIIEMFRLRDRKPSPSLCSWSGEFAGKYLISAVQASRMSPGSNLDEFIKKYVDELISTQAANGYMGPFPKEYQLLVEWDLWGHYHVMLGLYDWYKKTGDKQALNAALRCADLVCKIYLEEGRNILDAGAINFQMNTSIIHILGILYTETGNPKYLEMMKKIEKEWESTCDYFRAALNGLEFYESKCPRWESLHGLEGLFELYLITGDERYKRALLNYWHSINKLDIHNSGAFSSGEQAMGNPFHRGAIETCCTVAWIALSIDALRLSHDSKIADAIENATLNEILGAQHPSGRWCTYNTPMDGYREASAHSIVFQSRAGTPELNCCSVNGSRGIGFISEWAVMNDGNDIFLNFYGRGQIKATLSTGEEITIKESTAYPKDGKIKIELLMSKPRRLALNFRVPNWSKHTTICINSDKSINAVAGQYARSERLWASGDVIDIEFDMSVRTLVGDELVDYGRSVFYGPLLLAVDQKYNSFDCPQMPMVNKSIVNLKMLSPASSRFEPIVLFQGKAANGTDVNLCDFASAGAYGTQYRSWLPTDQNASENQYVKKMIFKNVHNLAQSKYGASVAASDYVVLQGRGDPNHVLNNNPYEYWVSSRPPAPDKPCWLLVDLGAVKTVKSIVADNMFDPGVAQKFSIEVSKDGNEYTPVLSMDNSRKKYVTVTLADSPNIRFIRYVVQQAVGAEYCSLRKLEVYGIAEKN